MAGRWGECASSSLDLVRQSAKISVNFFSLELDRNAVQVHSLAISSIFRTVQDRLPAMPISINLRYCQRKRELGDKGRRDFLPFRLLLDNLDWSLYSLIVIVTHITISAL